jgi:hypothetical protein
MRTSAVIPVFLVLFCLSFFSASPAHAQCGVNTLGFGNLGIVKDNPFHAEVVSTSTGQRLLTAISARKPELVARDSQGRIRTERVVGEYKRDTGSEAGSTAEQRMIMICDPVAQTLTQIDTLNATAKIIHSRPSAPNSSLPSGANSSRMQHRSIRTFCDSRLMMGSQPGRPGVEDLGYKTIEGVQAHGARIAMPTLIAPGSEVSTSTSDTERWCSDELSAIVLTTTENSKSGSKSTVVMQNIERTEPDPSLFQIPPDYAVTESVAEPHSPHATVFAQP